MTRDAPLLSVVVPAYNAEATIAATLHSVAAGSDQIEARDVETIVVDDGSGRPEALTATTAQFPGVRLIRHDVNRGMAAARNTGIEATRGRYVTILDADDLLVPEWGGRFLDVVAQAPSAVGVIFAGCVNAAGEPTVPDPGYTGPLTLDDFLHERRAGEYLPIFRGAYVRERRYVDLGMRKSCGTLSYLRFLQDGPIWVAAPVLRVYNDARAGSVTAGWASTTGARESARCTGCIMERFGDLYLQRAPSRYRGLALRLAVYRRLAGDRGAWSAWWRGASLAGWRETAGALLVLLLGRRFAVRAVGAAKSMGLVKRYG